MLKSTLIIKQISTEETIDVRQTVLRAGKPREDCYFDGDDLPGTFHLGIFDENQLVGVATFMENSHSFFSGRQLQLRGMAVLESHQGKRLGAQILKKGEAIALKRNIQTIWCNARIIAMPFYENLGYQIVGDPFEIAPIGIHYVMKKELK